MRRRVFFRSGQGDPELEAFNLRVANGGAECHTPFPAFIHSTPPAAKTPC
ncbi:hypothetical protein QT982_24085 [Microcoleus sp. herbarium2]|uniref:Uncharacterized protein n=1 Tax=Stenomitos frigidus AS-A4 TaxID=2933935 RepID=A0ABV0KX29_9CYAN|nr:hypothetical protein [Phormidium sp. FACHB-592]